MTEGMLDEIMSEGATAPEVTTETVTQAPEPIETAAEKQARDEAGRFAAKAIAEGNAPAAVEEPEPEGGQVPQQALHAARQKEKEAREQATELTRTIQQMQGQINLLTQQRQPPAAPAEPVKPPDFWEDPNKYVESALTPFQQELQRTRFHYSQRDALREHGQEKVNAAEEALKQALTSGSIDKAGLKAHLANSIDPVGDVVRWHLNSPQMKEASLREQIKAEILAEMNPAPAADPAVPPGQTAPLTKLPPSLSRLTGGNAAADGDMSDEGLFNHAMAR